MKEGEQQAPIINHSIDEEVVFSPRNYLDYKKNKEGKHIPEVPESCILVFENSFIDHARERSLIEEIPWFREDVKIYRFKEYDILILHVHYGAALSAIAMEELIAMGIRNFVILGSAGTLQDHIPLGSIMIADRAIREEGVSYHYAIAAKYAHAGPKLLQLTKHICEKSRDQPNIGTVWTTDSFYRETLNKTKRYKAEGVLSVDMETAALYTIAQYRNVEAISIFYTSDSIANLQWNPGFHHTNNKDTRQTMIELALSILRSTIK